MNDQVILKAIELHETIKNDSIVIEFLRLKQLFENDDSLAILRKEIAKESQNQDKRRYDELKAMYDNHPLVSNYYQLKEEVVMLLSEIRDILSI